MGNLIKETPYSEITATLEVLDRHGVSREHFVNLRKDAELAKKIADLIVGTKQFVDNLFSAIVDYSRSLEDMITAGQYTWVNDDITEKHFPIPKPPVGLPTKAEIKLELIHFNKVMTSDKVLAELKKQGLRPATLPELLAFGEKYPEKQREFTIVALCSVWRSFDGGRRVPCLWGGSDWRRLSLSWGDDDWHDYYRFLAVRES